LQATKIQLGIQISEVGT